MGVQRVSTAADIAISGLQAQAKRINVISANIANSGTTRTEAGGPYRRQSVVLSTKGDGLTGVSIQGVSPDMVSPLQKIYSPGSPDADTDGFLQMPNVDLPTETMQMVSASRTYQANVAVLKRYTELVDVTLELLK